MTNPVVGWHQLKHYYNYKTMITITNLDIIWIARDRVWQEIYTTIDLDF